MGRELYTVVRTDNDHTVWDSADDEKKSFCGRYNETSLIASLADDNGYVDITDESTFKTIEDELVDFSTQAEEAYAELKQEYDDLCAARRNARTLKDFEEFTDSIHTLRTEVMDSYDYHRATDMLKLMRHTRDVANNYRRQHPNYVYKIFWVVSE